jgi:hypothetical protein
MKLKCEMDEKSNKRKTKSKTQEERKQISIKILHKEVLL